MFTCAQMREIHFGHELQVLIQIYFKNIKTILF
jgi:hypothetical protein